MEQWIKYHIPGLIVKLGIRINVYRLNIDISIKIEIEMEIGMEKEIIGIVTI